MPDLASLGPQAAIGRGAELQRPERLDAGIRLPEHAQTEDADRDEQRGDHGQREQELRANGERGPTDRPDDRALPAARGGAQVPSVGDDPAKVAEVGEEIADVLCYVLALANELNLDLSTALREKMVKNAIKYPAELSRGKSDPPLASE